MKNILKYGPMALLTLHLASPQLGLASPAEVQWQQSYGGSSNDFLFAMVEAVDGGYLLGGYSYSTNDATKQSVNYGESDFWIVCTDATGARRWDRSYGGNQVDLLYDMRTTENGYILGGTSLSGVSGNKTAANLGLRDYWVLQLDSQGDILWQNTYGGTGSDYLQHIKPVSEGGYLLSGYSFSITNGNKTSLNLGLIDYWVVRIDASGHMLWDRSLGGGGNDYLSASERTLDGGYILAGYSFSSAGGNKTASNHGGSDYWIVRLDSNGNQVWDRSFGGTMNEYCQGILALSDGGFLVGGYSFSSADGNKTSASLGRSDFWLLKLNGDGFKVWEKVLGGTGDDNAWTMNRTAAGTVLMGGWSDSPPDQNKSGGTFGRSDFWVTELSEDGDLWEDYSFGGAQDEVILSILPLEDSHWLVGGYSFSGMNGTKKAPARGGSDFWILQLQPVIDSENPLPVLTAHRPLNGQISGEGFRFTLKGQTGATYLLEYSTNTIDWIPFRTNHLEATEAIIDDQDATASPHRYYRAVELP